MKTLLLAFSILLAFPVFGQNYRTVYTDSEVYFDFKDAIDVHYSYSEDFASRVIFTDSFQVFNADTIIFHRFNHEFELHYASVYGSQFQGYYDSCFSEIDTGFLSYKTILQNDGTDIYFNRFHDSIFIQTQANLNDTWVFYQNLDGNYYEATVTGISNESFLGLTDSIKTISVQAKDSLGNNIISPYDTLDIKISQHYGLVKGFNFFRFPYGVTINEGNYQRYFKSIELIGLPQHNIGVKNLTSADVYDYDIGDEFHWHYKVHGDDGLGGSFQENTYDIMIINNKQFSVDGNSVYYDIHLETYQSIRHTGSNFNNYSFDTLFIGDSTISYDLANSKINTYTLYQDWDSVVTWIQTKDGNRKYIEFGDNVIWNENGCFITELHEGGSSTFHKGIGETFYYASRISPTFERTFLYYNKNGTIYGTPVNIDSLSTVSTKSIVKNDLNLNVFPNPTTDILNFQFKAPIDNAEIRIYSSIGQLVGQTALPLPQMNVQFDVSDWSSGVYFYGVYVEGVLVKQGQVLVED